MLNDPKLFTNIAINSAKFCIKAVLTLQDLANEMKQDAQLKTKLEIKQIITYEEAIEYFVENRPNDPSVEKGAILRQPHSQGQTILQVFLNENNEVVCNLEGDAYGRKLVVRQIDKELLTAFGNKHLIIVE